jgi:GNAT superfamily N-acetyltransferase
VESKVEMITVDDADKAAEEGFFCYKSKRRTQGYRRKLAWLEQRFREGLQIRIIREGGRSVGFIEYTPGEFAWRPLKAPRYLFVHCLWVVGRAKEKGYGSSLLGACIEDARATGKHGVAVLTRKGGYLMGKRIFVSGTASRQSIGHPGHSPSWRRGLATSRRLRCPGTGRRDRRTTARA